MRNKYDNAGPKVYSNCYQVELKAVPFPPHCTMNTDFSRKTLRFLSSNQEVLSSQNEIVFGRICIQRERPKEKLYTQMDQGQEKDFLDERKSISQDTLPRIRWTGDLGGEKTSLVRAKRSCSQKGAARVVQRQVWGVLLAFFRRWPRQTCCKTNLCLLNKSS